MTGIPDAMEHVLAPWPLAGRDAVVDRGVSALSGHARTLIVSGDSGVGKTRVAAAIGAALTERGWTVLTASATSIMAAVPLGVLLAILPSDRLQLAESAADPAVLLARAIAAIESTGPAPRLLLLDDLGLLDPLSTTLIAQLVATDVVRLAATIRSGHPVPDAVLSGWSADRALRIELAPLGLADFEALLGEVLGGQVAHRTASELHRASGGNPLFLRELVVSALERDGLVAQGGVWHLAGGPVQSPALRDLILARIAHLDAAERDVVDRLAVCGDLPASQLTADGARAALGRLEAAGIIEVGPRLDVRLAHPQYGAIVAGSLSRLHAADLLLEQADVVQRKGSGAGDELRAVTWRLSAGVESDPDLLVSAARLARQAGDLSSVERLSTAALAAGGPRADAHLLHGEALLRMGRPADALDDLRVAASLAQDGELATEIAGTMAMAHISIHDGLADALAVLRSAEDGLDCPDPALALIRSLVELYANHAAEADHIVVDVAGGFGDSPEEKAIIAAARAQPLAALGRIDEAMEAARISLAFARATDGKAVPGHTVASALHTLAVVQLNAGRIDDARTSATAALVEAIGADDEIVTRSVEYLLGRIAADAGRVETAARWFRDTMSGAMTIGPISLHIPATASLAIVLIAHGDTDAARRELGAMPPDVDAGPAGVVARAWLSALDGDLDAARTELLAHSARMAASGHNFLAGTFLHTLARLGDANAAAGPLSRLAEGGAGPLVALQAAHVAAEVASDVDGLIAAGEAWSACGAHLRAAEAFASAARCARASARQRDAVALQSRADESAARCEGASTPLLRFTDELSPLTRREREIASLASAGSSSKEIAAKLFLSTRTVDNHLQSVYGKLGISGRHELARL